MGIVECGAANDRTGLFRKAVVLLVFSSFAGFVVAEEQAKQAPEASVGPPARPEIQELLAAKPVLHLSVAERLRWDRDEKALFSSYVALSAVDAYQTIRQPEGSRELNPLLSSWAGDRPGAMQVLLFKSVTTYGVLKMANLTKSRRKRKIALWLLNAMQFGVVARNEHVTGGVLFD